MFNQIIMPQKRMNLREANKVADTKHFKMIKDANTQQADNQARRER
jgi:hypothetical protein